jgi:predicted transcriptional regulator
MFYANLRDSHYGIDVSKEELEMTPPALKRFIKTDQGEKDEYRIEGDESLMSMLKYSHSPEVREKYFKAHSSSCDPNFSVLLHLLY